MTAYITGVGWVSASGMGYGSKYTNFSMKKGPLPDISRKDVFTEPYKAFGRMDKFSKIGLAAIAFALRDAELEKWSEKRNIGTIASTFYGCLNTDISYYHTVIQEEGILASPGLFAYTLPNCFLGEASICFGMTGTGFVINEQSSYGFSGLETAFESIECMEHEIMLCGFCETGCPPNFEVVHKADEDISGALFFVVEKNISDNSRNYGEITCVGNNDVLFDDTVVSDLCMLAEKCLENNPG
jgi:3-oxoacyl-[acyl-carrier-protein] synthase II